MFSHENDRVHVPGEEETRVVGASGGGAAVSLPEPAYPNTELIFRRYSSCRLNYASFIRPYGMCGSWLLRMEERWGGDVHTTRARRGPTGTGAASSSCQREDTS